MNVQAGIPLSEYPQRLERLRRFMVEKKMHAVLLGTGNNLRYFSGYPSPSRSIPRPFFTLLPLNGDPVFFSHTGHKAESERYSWIGDVRDYTELSRVPIDLLRAALAEKHLLGRTIGMELGFEQALDISYLEFCRLAEAFGETRLVDAAEILWRVRMIKSPAEIACVREACRITSEAYNATFAAIPEKATELEVFRSMHDRLERESMGDIFLAITSGQGNYDLVTKPPDARPLRKEDFLWMDAGCTVSGYWSDFSRAGVAGNPSVEQAEAQQTIHEITSEAVQRIRPGVTASSVAQFCSARLDDLRFPVTSSITALASRVGHGLGLNMTEPPHISIRDDTRLEAGMIITIEPGVATAYGTFHVEENVLVTEDGFEILSQCPRELRKIAVA
jgi:Xaa-Pro dipeptidase